MGLSCSELLKLQLMDDLQYTACHSFCTLMQCSVLVMTDGSDDLHSVLTLFSADSQTYRQLLMSIDIDRNGIDRRFVYIVYCGTGGL